MKTYNLVSSYPDHLTLTDRSIKLFKEGASGQGYIGILDTTSGMVHLLPAFNKDDGKERVNKDGERFSDYLESPKSLYTMKSNLHEDAAKALGLSHLGGQEGRLMGFSIWKDEEGNIAEFLNRSTSQNRFAIKRPPLYKEFYNDGVFYHSAHLLELQIELPREISQDIYTSLTTGLKLPVEDVRISSRVNERVRQHFTVEDSYFANFSDKYTSPDPEDFDHKTVWDGFEFLKNVIDGNRISTFKLFIAEVPCVISGRTPESRGSSDESAAETALTYALSKRKYNIARILLENGASWQEDSAINAKLIRILEKQIKEDPEHSRDATEILKHVRKQNTQAVQNFFESSVGKELIEFAKKNNKMDVMNKLNLEDGSFCMDDIKTYFKTEKFKLSLTQGTNYLSYLYFFVASEKTVDSKIRQQLDNIIEKLDAYQSHEPLSEADTLNSLNI